MIKTTDITKNDHILTFLMILGPKADTLVKESNNEDNHYNPSTGNDSTGMIFFVTGFIVLVIGIVALLLLRRI